jgi:hypothetical protein
MQPENEITSYFGLTSEMLVQMLNNHTLMYHIACIPNTNQLDKFSELIHKKERTERKEKTEKKEKTERKEKTEKKERNFKKKFLKHDYITSKNKRFLAACNEKLFKAASIVKENERKLKMYKEKFLNTAEIMKETEEKLIAYERELIHFPALTFLKEKSINPNNEDAHLQCPQVVEKDFNELTVDELIYMYFQVDESSSQLVEKEFEYTSIVCEK